MKKFRILIVVLLTSALFMTGCTFGGGAATPTGPPEQGQGPRDVDPGLAGQLQSYLDQAVKEYAVPGAVLSIITSNNQYWTGSSGVADLETNRKLEPTYRFRIGSITKTFVALLMLQQVQDGKLTLDDAIDKFYPGLVKGGDKITVRLLLNHSSGLYDYLNEPTSTFMKQAAANTEKMWDPADIVATTNNDPRYFDPGKGWHYSNTNYLVVGLILEKVSGTTIENLIQRRIILPLGLDNTFFSWATRLSEPFARGYVENEGKLVDVTFINSNLSPFWTAGNMVSVASDVKTWALALQKGALLNEAMRKEMYTFLDTGMGFSYGLGLAYREGLYWHDGGIPGYTSEMGFSPSGNAVIVLLTNRTETPSKPFFDIVKNLIPLVGK
ncbi:MAG: serine hydrolase [Coprothermobacterota bacterium]|nr:serine hydrolase [Coprothermobacterota bacterium]